MQVTLWSNKKVKNYLDKLYDIVETTKQQNSTWDSSY